MAEYIEKAELIKKLCLETAEWYYSPTIKTIKEFPAADVQPVIHAKWVLFDKDCVGRAFYCSNCRKVTTTDDFEDTPLDRDEYFCMRCGADMRSPDATKR